MIELFLGVLILGITSAVLFYWEDVKAFLGVLAFMALVMLAAYCIGAFTVSVK